MVQSTILKELISKYISKWETMGVEVVDFGIKKNEKQNGELCNIEAKRIWLNLN
jgi:hypothetical protein